MIPRRVRLAILVAFVCHGLFITTARYRLSYDAFTHMLFANHYAEHWFSLWESRWYTGFNVTSYPPLVHQLIAIFIPMLGFDKAFALILWLVTTFYPLGIYAFSRIFIGKTTASYAALAAALMLPIYVTAYIFGQLPFLTGTLLALFSAASLDRFLREGGLPNFLLTISLYATTMAAHHATLLAQPFLIISVLANYWLQQATFKSSYFMQQLSRLMSFAKVAIPACLIVILPFWQWGQTQALQTPIDHLSRHNFIADPFAILIFFLPLYGLFAFIIPFIFMSWHLRFLGLQFAFSVLFLLGLGGTTPLPRLLFGTAWQWLTYDRFAFWACLTLTPLFGVLFVRLKKKLRLILKPTPATLRKTFPSALTFSLLAATTLGAWFTPYFIRLQPDPIDLQPIVDFLNTTDRSQYRYLTFGFGDQFAYLNLLTHATTIDGSYHTARELPELRRSGIGQIDTSYWALNGMQAIVPILQLSGEHGVRWGLINPATLQPTKVRWGNILRSPFIPVLEKLGWAKIATLENGILVFENPNAQLPETIPPPKTNPWIPFIWGVLPIFSAVTTLSLAGFRVYPLESKRIQKALFTFIVSLIPLSLGFWIFQPIVNATVDRVYFTYTDALFFFSDGLMILALTVWASSRLFISHQPIVEPAPLRWLGIALIILMLASVFWSNHKLTTFYIAAHFLLLIFFIRSVMDNRQVWDLVMFGCTVALTLQIIAGFGEFALQTTALVNNFNMEWPGLLDPSMSASVVQLTDGVRILRAYGTLPHPNILGGLILLYLAGPAYLYLEKNNRPALILLSLGIILLMLTFSRSAWLAFIVFLFILIIKSKHFERKKVIAFVSVCFLTITLTLYPLRELIFTRVGNTSVPTEQLSNFGRTWLMEQALQMMRYHPLTGVGLGAFVTELSKIAVSGAIIEPIHNIFLLAGAELGIFGTLSAVGIFVTLAYYVLQARSPKAVLSSATLSGLGVITLFDHYLWTLAPSRIMLAFAIGLWLGQFQHES